ncbi:hypothetical protein POUND7_005582, partial [Theobroma cacao]
MINVCLAILDVYVCCGYGQSFPVSAEALNSSFCLPIGKAKIEREGKDVTITAFSKMVGYALKAADMLAKEGINAEVINLRSIRPLDRATINTSVRKTNRLVTVEEGFPQNGVGAEICASVVEESFEFLDAPVERIGAADVPMPYAANLERMAVPQVMFNIDSPSIIPKTVCSLSSCVAFKYCSRSHL